MTVQARVSAFRELLLFESEIEVNKNRKGQALPKASLSLHSFRDFATFRSALL